MQLKKITLDAKSTIDAYIKPWHSENADHCFTTLYLWGRHGKITYAEEDGVLYLFYHFPDVPPFFLPPIPEKKDYDYEKALHTAFSYMKKQGFSPCLRSVAKPFSTLISQTSYSFSYTPSPWNYDYIYLKESLKTLSGKKLHSKRNHLNRFLDAYSDWVYEPLDESMLKECMDLYDNWSEGKTEHTLVDYDERITVELSVKHMHELGLFGGCIRLDGKMQAFSLGEKLTSDMAVVHIEKADPSINGLFPLINQQFVLHECDFATYINREDDMGIEGLRKAKESYHPIRMIEKTIATPHSL